MSESANQKYDLVIIGAGPGGYVAAIRAAQLGLKVALVEKEARLGGTCLRIGCIPSKALLESSHHYQQASHHMAEHGIELASVSLDLATLLKRKDGVVAQLTDGVASLMKKNKIEVIHGLARLQSASQVEVQGSGEGAESRSLEAKAVLLATGSESVELDMLPFDGDHVVSSTEALSFDSVPESLLVIGAGAIGLELGQVWSRLGSKVTVVEMLPHIAPFADALPARLLMRSLKEQGMEFHVGTKLLSAEVNSSGVVAKLEDAKQNALELSAQKVLVAVGRKPNTQGLGLKEAGVELDEKGFVKVDEHWQSKLPGVYAIGDLIGNPMLAHKAEDEGLAVAELLAGKSAHVNYETIPGVVYTHPELAQVGKTEQQCKEEGIKVNKGQFYFRANGRALASSDTDGVVKIIADAQTDQILGVHILGRNASELIAEAVVAMEYKASAEDLARTCHAHPTLSEAIREAALAVDKRAIHA